METISEKTWELMFDKISESPAGIAILCVVTLIISCIPLWKWLYSLYKEQKEKKAEEREKRKKDDEELRKTIQTIAKHLPELDKQVLSLSSEVSEFKSIKKELIDTNHTLQNNINEMKDTTKKIESDMGILFEGENNEFRIFLAHLHAKHVEGDEPMTREIRQELRIRFDSYEKRHGNGWAKELYLELMSIPIESSDISNECI